MKAKELNAIQREWMQLDILNASDDEKKRVYKLYGSVPTSFLSVRSDLECCTVIHNNLPVAHHVSLEQGVDMCAANKWRTDVAWSNAGEWIDL